MSTQFLKTSILLAGMTALFLTIGYMLGGQGGMIIAFIIAGAMNVISYWNSDKIILKIYKAKPLTMGEHPRLLAIVEKLARNADMPVPKSYIMRNPQPNAFATGRNPDNAAVAVTTGLLDRLNEREVAGVIAHELAHIKNRDTLIMTVTATIAGAIGMLANFAMFFGGNRERGGMLGTIAMMIIAPMAASLVQMAISRTREYRADAVGAEICGDPEGLASALAKISNSSKQIMNNEAEHNPATAHLFISNPLQGLKGDGLFTTHPATQNRIDALLAQAAEMSAEMPARAFTLEETPTHSSSTSNRSPWR